METNKKLKEYIENNIFPEYKKNDLGHNLEHIKYVIDRSFKFASRVDNVNYDMVYTIAAYHDIGHHIDAKNHEKVSADILRKDKELKKYFNEEEIKIMAEAVEDHRASKSKEKLKPRSVYGEIVSSADRNISIQDCLSRTYTYGKNLNPLASDEELFERAYDALNRKFGKEGYAKFYFKDKKYANFLKEIRALLANKENFCNVQRQYIKELKKLNRI